MARVVAAGKVAARGVGGASMERLERLRRSRPRRPRCSPRFAVLIGRDYREGAVRRRGSAPLSIVARDRAVFYGPFGLSAGGAYGATTAVVKSSPSRSPI